MKAIILAGGYGTRLAEETGIRPKPMVEIGGQPILWHIMKHCDHHGIREFHVALGYRGDMIKRYFMDYYALSCSLTVNLGDGEISYAPHRTENWLVHLNDTGTDTMTGGRLKRLESQMRNETFMLTYGDGVSDVDLARLLRFHRERGRVATVTAVRPPARFGSLVLDGDDVREFAEKPQIGEGWINGGYIIFEPGVFDYLERDSDSLEADALRRLAQDGQVCAFRHEGFWQCMDTLREKQMLERHWLSGNAPWKVWED